MMVWMKQIIAIHVLYNLKEDNSLNDLAENAEYCHRPVVFGQERIIFF